MKIENWKLKIGFLGLVLLAIGFFYFTQKATAAWWDDTWGYRQKVEITNTGSAQTDFQTMITLDTQTLATAGKIQTDCDDLRITDNLGNLLNFWIEPTTCNTTTTKIWVKLSSIPASGATIYLYYGNSSASSGQSATTSVFIREISNVQASWALDETSSPSLDSSGGGNNGTWNSNTSTTGKFGNAANFPGNSHITTGSKNWGFSTTGTIAAWIKTTDTGNGAVFSLAQGTIQDELLLHMDSGHKIGIYNHKSSGNYWSRISSTLVNTGSWVYVVGVINGTGTDGLKIYVNGVEETGTTTTAGSPSDISDTTARTVTIGWRNNQNAAEDFIGQIDDVKVYSAALSQAEITDLYGSGGNNQGYVTTNYANKELVRKYSASVSNTVSNNEQHNTQGPVEYWRFDEGYGTTVHDSTTNKNNGTITGATWTAEDQCISGKCLQFNGTSDYVGIGTTANAVQTVSFWVKPSTNTASLMDLDGGSHYISASSGTISATGFSSPAIYVNGKTSTTLTANTWQYITVTTSTSFNSTNITIGKQSSNYVQGFIDEVKIYNYARTAAQIKTDYASRGSNKGAGTVIGQAPQDFMSNGLVGYWKLEESSTPSVDSSGNGRSGTWAGNVAAGAGKFGNGITLDGTGDYVDTGSASSLNVAGGNATFAAWFKATSLSSYNTIFEYGPGGNGYYFGLLNSKPYIVFYGSVITHVHNSTTTLNTTTWYHLVATWNVTSKTTTFYINGVLDGTASTSNADPLTTNQLLRIGARGSGSLEYSGLLDDLRIYNRALSPAEIQDLYEFAPGPVVQLKMDENSGTSANDSSGNNRTGTLNGNPVWAPGKYGAGVKLDGTGDNVSVGDFGY